MKQKSKPKAAKTRWQLLHQYYSYTGFYNFVWQTVIKALPYIIAIVIAVYTLNHFWDINNALIRLTEILPSYGVLSFFFVSETLLGLMGRKNVQSVVLFKSFSTIIIWRWFSIVLDGTQHYQNACSTQLPRNQNGKTA